MVGTVFAYFGHFHSLLRATSFIPLGASIYDIRKILVFFEPLPLVNNLELIYTKKFMQHPLCPLLICDSHAPLDCGHHILKPPCEMSRLSLVPPVSHPLPSILIHHRSLTRARILDVSIHALVIDILDQVPKVILPVGQARRTISQVPARKLLII